MVYFTCYQINIQAWVIKDILNEIVIAFFNWLKSYQILQIHIEMYQCELWIINITLYAEVLLRLHVEA